MLAKLESAQIGLFPPHKHVSAFHVLGQDSKIKGTRLVEVYWHAEQGVWYFPREDWKHGISKIQENIKNCWKYSPKELLENRWIYMEAGRI